jgi:hypothetical protein
MSNTIQHERDLAGIAAKDPRLLEDASLAALVTYSLFWLHEWELRRSIEAITVLSWRLFPTKFSMVGWPQYPDSIRTTRSLLQCQPKYRNWLTGSATKGYSLNERGMQVARDLVEKLGVPQTSNGGVFNATPINNATVPKGGRARSIEPEREIKEARNSRLFEKWKGEVMSERDLIHVHALLNIFEHTPGKLRTKRMKDLERAALDIDDKEMIRFFEDVRRNFPSVFSR